MMIPSLPNLIRSASDTQRLFCPGRGRPRPGPGLGRISEGQGVLGVGQTMHNDYGHETQTTMRQGTAEPSLLLLLLS